MVGVRYNFKAVGAQDVQRALTDISAKLKQNNGTLDDQVKLQRDARTAIKLATNEGRLVNSEA